MSHHPCTKEASQEDSCQEHGSPVPIFLTAIFLTVLFAVVLVSPAVAVETPESDVKEVDFARDIKPIFKQHCFGCHGSNKQESEFRVDVRATLLTGGDLGEPAVVPGKSDESNLIRLVSGLDPDRVMPPEGERLTER